MIEPIDFASDVRRMRAMGLNRDERQVWLYLIWGAGPSLADYARRTGTDPAKARQDKRRGLAKILGYFALTADDKQVITASTSSKTRADAALSCGMSEAEYTRSLRTTLLKISEAYEEAGRIEPDG